MLKKGNIALILGVILILASCKQPEKPKEVVIFLPYGSMTQIYQSAQKAAMDEFSDSRKYHLTFYPVTENAEDLYNDRSYCPDASQRLGWQLQKVIDSLITPDLIILHGDRCAYAAAFLDSPVIKNTPLLSTGVVHPHYQNYLSHMHNMVVMESRPEIKKNVDFITELGFSNYIVTEMDSTFIDDHIREHITDEFRGLEDQYRTNLYLQDADRFESKIYRDSRPTLFPISMTDTLKNDRHPDMEGGFKLNWVFSTQMEGTTYFHLKDDAFSNRVMSLNVGLYISMTPEYFNLPLINSLNSCFGGYMTPYPSMWKQVHPIVDKLLTGTSPKQISWGTLEKDYWLDWRLAKNIHDYADEFPKGVNFVNLPWNHRSRALMHTVYTLAGLLVLFIIIYVVIIPAVLFRKSKKQLGRLVNEARMADESNTRVNKILTQLNSYIWYMNSDFNFEFSKSFYWDFNIPMDKAIPFENLKKRIHEPGRGKLHELLFNEGNKEEEELEILVDIPGSEQPRVVRLHAINLSDNVEDKGSSRLLKAGFFYFNDEFYRLNNELNQAYRRSEELKEKESFLTTMNDEFRKPVEIISFYSHLLAEQYNTLNEEQKDDYLTKVLDANTQIIDLLNETMSGVAHSNDSSEIRLSKLKVASLIEEVFARFTAIENRNYRIDLYPGPSDSTIESFRPELLLVINTLISNTVNQDITSKNTAKRIIEIGWTESSDEEVIIFVGNVVNDIHHFNEIIGKIGGRIEVMEFPGEPVRIELSFRSLRSIGGGAKKRIRR